MAYPELIKTHRQFEAIVKNVNQQKDSKAANKLVTDLLSELNVQTVNC